MKIGMSHIDAGLYYRGLLSQNSRTEIESFCRQILALCDKDYMAEIERLKAEECTIIERRKREAIQERGIDEAPGVILTADEACEYNFGD